MKRIILYIIIIWSTQELCMAQIKINGRILSADRNISLPGASITVKGSSSATYADTSGRFNLIRTPSEKILTVSYIGYQTREVQIDDKRSETELLIFLEPLLTTLEEVIVSTGYQNIPAERSTGSFTLIDHKTFNQQVSTDILSRLEAVANGLMVDRTTNASGRLMIRGLSTIRGSKEPLIVLDNFPYDGDITNINPNDVENITLLKDAAAASIWGAKAGNGVIVITTKKGKFNMPLQIDFNSTISLNQKPDLSYLPQISSSEYINVEQMLFNKGFYNSQINSMAKPPLSPVIELLVQKSAGSIPAMEAEARINALRMVDVRDEFNKYLYQQGLKQQYSGSAKGGSENSAWNFSAGLDKNADVLDEGFNRVNLHFRQILSPVKNLRLMAGLYYTLNKTTSGKPGYGSISSASGSLYPYAQFADIDGKALPIVKDYRQSYLSQAGNGLLLDWKYYPLEDYKNAGSATSAQDILANVDVDYQVLKGLTAGIKYQYERQGGEGRNHLGIDSYTTRNLINLYTQVNPANGQITYAIPKGGILDLSNSLLQSHNFRGQLTFNRTWKGHSISALAGGELRQSNSTRNSARVYGYNDEILTSSSVDFINRYPTFITGSASLIPNNSGFSNTLNRFVSPFVNAAYTLNDKITLSGSARSDASNLFGVNTNNKWQPLWSVGAAWELSQEKFFKLPFLSFMKLRATHGISGNTDPSMSGVTTIRYSSTSPFTMIPYALPDRFANPELTWEKVRMLNLAVDFRSANSRISGSLEYYSKNATDLFGTAEIDYTTGIGNTIIKNVASMSGKGADLQLTTQNLVKAFKWTSDINLSYTKDKVRDYYLPSLRGSNFVSNQVQPNIAGIDGKPVYSIFSYRWAGLDPATGNPQGYLGKQISSDYTSITGVATSINDLIYHGPALPRVFGSVGNTFGWKNLSLSARISYKLAYFFRRESIVYSSLFAGNGHSDYSLRWQKPGDEVSTAVPSMVYPNPANRDAFYNGSDILVEKGDHVRLQYITASYELRKERFSRLPFKVLQIYTNVNDPVLLWTANTKGIDPEYRRSGNLRPSGTISFGIRGTFN